MRRLAVLLALLGSLAGTSHAAPRCSPPEGHRVTSCRLGAHGTPDLGRAAWRARTGAEVTISVRIDTLAPNPADGGARRWPLVDSLGLPVARVEEGFVVTLLDGRRLKASSVRVRGRGCMADTAAQRRSTLVQLHVPGTTSRGTQAFLPLAALPETESGRAARAAFAAQRGTGCGPSGRIRGTTRPLADPAVGRTAHARLSSGVLNSVDEYDAKPDFAGVVYFSSNTTSVRVGGIARGMVRVGTPVAKVDRIPGCDPNSDGTLTWRYLAISTGLRARPTVFGWIPARCRP